MKKFILSIAIFMLTISVNANAAIIPNAGFENGNLSGWTTTGTGLVSVETSKKVSDAGTFAGPTSFTTHDPNEGNYFASIQAGTPKTSIMSSKFWVDKDQVVSAAVAFSSSDYFQYNDNMFWGIADAQTGSFFINELITNVKSVGDHGYLDWFIVQSVMETSGYVTASFFVTNVSDHSHNSIGFVDNLQVTDELVSIDNNGGSTGEIPTPPTLALLGLGLIGMIRSKVIAT